MRTQGGRSAELVGHVHGFLGHRLRIAAHWRAVSPGDRVAKEVRPFAHALRQQRPLGSDTAVASIDELYEAAAAGARELGEVLAAVTEGLEGVVVKLAPLKEKTRALEKANGELALGLQMRNYRGGVSLTWLLPSRPQTTTVIAFPGWTSLTCES
jgi:hypothetical protein